MSLFLIFFIDPSLCIDSLHFDSSILDLCERTTSPESLQKMSNKKLAEGIPLFSSLKENQKSIRNDYKDHHSS